MAPLQRLTRRTQFLKVAAGRRKSVSPGLILQALPQAGGGLPNDGVPQDGVRVGFTASRKVGNAVARNRARRRLRAAAAQVLPVHAAVGHDYVVIARLETLERLFGDLLGDLAQGLKRLGVYRA
jgi:ribonuclease P protein component